MGARRAQRRFFVMAVLSALFGVSFYFLSYAPQHDALRAKEAEAASLRRELGEWAAFRRAHPDPVKEATAVGERKNVVDAMLPERLETGTFLAEAEKRAASTGIVLLGASPGNPKMTDGLAMEKMRISVRGDYFALLDFLYALEQQGRFVKIDTMRGTVEDGVFKGDLELWIYARSI
ncbi:MAG: type 4a pilus biogenesis protein PilO [Schwartzia sp.]|nr:type 4a pilus biogenesis protein PilO [Schwartzia sp. (in: firmicutes)]